MFLTFQDRPSESPLIDRVWRSRSTAQGGLFHSIAAGNLELVFSFLPGLTMATLRGPETQATVAQCPPDSTWLAIRFSPGTYLPRIPTGALIDRQDMHLPTADGRFWFGGEAWRIPTFESAEGLVRQLESYGILDHDSAVCGALSGDPMALSLRSIQRRFLHATGMTHGRFHQIGRARHATNLLRSGVSILDAVALAGYFDQPHLTRALKSLIGQTPGRILRKEAQLSFLYKTAPPEGG
jgi:hypothetical protein